MAQKAQVQEGRGEAARNGSATGLGEIWGQVEAQARAARAAARRLATLSSAAKDAALFAMAAALEEHVGDILAANAGDLARARQRGVRGALLDRLTLNERRVVEMAEGLRAVAALPDPIGVVEESWRRPNGLEIGRMRVPLGVVGIIYEARPNVTADAAGLCLKAGNAVLLRGSSEAAASNAAIGRVLDEAARGAGVPAGAIQLVDGQGHEAARALMGMTGLVDVLIPRGGGGLIRSVVQNASVPVIETGVGNCHVYVDQGADLDEAAAIVVNAKTSRPGVCNAAETLLVHQAVAEAFLPKVGAELRDRGVELRGCPRVQAILPGVRAAGEEDWQEEFLDLILAVRVVDDLEAALEHIATYGTGHSEAIVTRDYRAARRFLQEVDAAAVYVNASTRFTDGHQFGLGAEIGISTQKLHARGPMGLRELTTTKFVVYGDGQVRE